VFYAIASSEAIDERPPAEAVELRSVPASETMGPQVAEPEVPPNEVGDGMQRRDGPKPRRRDRDPHAVGQARPPAPPGPLDRDAIARVVVAQRASLQQCATAAGIRDGSSVHVNVALTILTSGRVSTASATSSGPHASAILPCVETKIRAWVFPASSSAISVRIPILIDFPPAPAPDTTTEVSAVEAPSMEAAETPEQRALRELPGTSSSLRTEEPVDDPVQACAAEGFGEPMNRCIVRTVRPVGQRNLRALAMAHRGLGDRANTCRTMRLYVDRYGSTEAAAQFRAYLASNCN
jgi:hypothetical protein